MKSFKLKQEHIKLLKNAYISWDDCEYGAPAIDCKRPYGNSDVEMEMVKILGYKVFEDGHGDKHLTKEQSDYLRKLHEETQDALQIILRNLEVKPGVYEASEYGSDWKFVTKESK